MLGATMVAEMASRVPIRSSGEARLRKLHVLKGQFFTPATRAARIGKSRTALNTPSKLYLSRDQWKAAAESPEFEEEF
jgi:hypothetical protein